MPDAFFSLKMRASRENAHISGAERIVPAAFVPKTIGQLAERALTHPKGFPDAINLKVEAVTEIQRLEALKVTEYPTKSAEEGMGVAASLLQQVGIPHVEEIFAKFSETYNMRGAMLLDVHTLERLEPDLERGIRATYMDDVESVKKTGASGKNHYAEAIVLATKVANAPGIVGEICVSDDPDYVTGYVATLALGYCRITTIKRKGDPAGGRIFLYDGQRNDVGKTIEFLERTPVLVDRVPILHPKVAERRMQGIEEELDKKRNSGLERRCKVLYSATGPVAKLEENGSEIVVMASNDYLDLARDERVTSAAAEAVKRWGAGSGGSRLTTGTQPPHVALERALANFKGSEAAITWSTGYMANVGVISAMVKKGDVILSDELNHASIIDGCKLSGADVLVYRHNDMKDLEHRLGSCREYRRRLVVSDVAFSMDGDILNFPVFLDLCRSHDAFSMVDEAHATGVLGATGHGVSEHFQCGRADIMLGTLSKALGSEGGYVCASQKIVDYLTNCARSFIFSTAPCAASAAAALKALEVLQAEPERVTRLHDNTAFFIQKLHEHGIEAHSESAIVPILIGDERKAMRIAETIRQHGFLIPAIRYPTVPKGAARLRAVMMSSHTRDDLARAANVIADALKAEMAE